MSRSRERPSHREEHEYRFKNQVAEFGGQEGADERDGDVDDPAEHSPLVRPCLVERNGQHGGEKNQREGHRAADARLRDRAAKLKKQDGDHGNQRDVLHVSP